eukprot:CAMPEP_0177783846 /NCGR_PEP_ID=MMETSP0491_2-20121128/19346_1 /TAXON_ID=63592 /ORGANISM="Tetraselmis chuii, Strain PLY429" /LENGTH=221 /DNA_ID=CAMNT_0019304495 /DNA_START=148 /DNA_END=813 /DNA_ORIENTATION=+
MCAATLRAVATAPAGPYPVRGRQAGCSSTAWRSTGTSHLYFTPWIRRRQGGRRPLARRAEERGTSDGPPLNIRVPQSRAASAPPAPISIMHSSTYNLRDGEEEVEGPEEEMKPVAIQKSPAGSPPKSSVDTFLQTVDEGLSTYEDQPPQAAKVFWSIANGPVGEAAGKGLRGAAKLTFNVGKEAIKVGAPAAGWAMKQGAKAAISLIAKSNDKKDKKPKRK